MAFYLNIDLVQWNVTSENRRYENMFLLNRTAFLEGKQNDSTGDTK